MGEMMECPKCSELISTDLAECPFCKTPVTEEMRKAVLEENERIHLAALKNTRKEYERRVKMEILIGVFEVLVAIGGCTFIAISGLTIGWIPVLGIALVGVYALCVVKLRIGCCPYCEQYMNGNILYRDSCPRCGGKLH